MSKCIYTQEQFDKILEERNELANENFKLRQHLAEKEKQYNNLQKTYYSKIDEIKNCSKSIHKIASRNEILERHHQDKISFAVEQLEKVKELVEEKSMTQSPFGTQKIYASDVSGVIDNQIKQLKEMK